MNARGYYGNRYLVGADTPVNRVFGGLEIGSVILFTGLGAWIGRSVTPKEPAKGGFVGGAFGFLAAYLRI